MICLEYRPEQGVHVLQCSANSYLVFHSSRPDTIKDYSVKGWNSSEWAILASISLISGMKALLILFLMRFNLCRIMGGCSFLITLLWLKLGSGFIATSKSRESGWEILSIRQEGWNTKLINHDLKSVNQKC